MNQQQWAAALLQHLGIRQTPGAMQAVIGWTKAEGGHWNNSARYNPLNTTQPEPGAGNTGTQGNIKVYKSWDQGLNATVQTLKNGRYGNILSALKAGNASAVGQAIGQSPWGTGGLAAKVIARTPATGYATQPPRATPAQAYGSVAPAPTDARRQLALSLIGFGGLGGSYGGQDPLTTALLQANQQQGKVQAPSYGGTSVPSGSIYSQKNLGRTDMGVDFTGKGAIPALGDAVVTRVQGQNSGTGWPGQGDAGRGNRGAIVVYKLLSGPAKGKYVYAAENLDPHVRVGQRVRAGEVIATARGSFPYTETGWAANAHGTTLASATTGYREGQQTQAGKSFRQFLGNLK